MELTFRSSAPGDVPRIMELVKQAQAFFRSNNINQWQNGYPNEQQIFSDIKAGASYIALQNGHIIGTSALYFGVEKDYTTILQGNWHASLPYAAIHRVAVDNTAKGRGIAVEMYCFLEEVCRKNNTFYVRGDTHRNNIAMQKFMEKVGFSRCGIIYLSDGAERIAYDKVLSRL